MKHFTFVCILTAGAALALAACGGGQSTPPAPNAAQPQTWHLQTGASAQQDALQGFAFYTSSLTIDAGDTVTWSFPALEPHTVTFLGPRSSPPPPTDPSVPAPAGGSTYDGTVYTSSGFLLGGKTYSLTFTKPGVYKYYCLIHDDSGMEGTITVQNARAAYPQTQSAIDTEMQSVIGADLQAAQKAVGEFPYAAGGTHLAAGISDGLVTTSPVHSSVLRFLDSATLNSSSVTVPVGTTITWTNLSSNEPHTVTFGIVGQPFPEMDPFSPASGGNTYDGTQVINSGPLWPGLSFSLTFTKAGTYTYHCLFHDEGPNMVGTVVVQ